MDHDITRFLKESEKLGEMGKFEDSERMAQEAEKIKK